MWAIFKKEFSSFFNSLIAYLVIGIFLVITGLLIWVFPETSVLEYGFADLETLFAMGPYVFMFLIPAVTMRSFAEEIKSGTMEMLLTKPLRDLQIILGKYSASLAIVSLALAPTLIYFYSIYQLGNPIGNIDVAGVMGSYIGLLLLAATFTAVGILASSLTENQIVAFILAVFFCFVLYTGISSIALIPALEKISLILMQFGVLYHYESISKGLIDSRDVIYFLSVITLMIMSTRFVLASRQW